MTEDEAVLLLTELYADSNGFVISARGRANFPGGGDRTLTYGEILPQTFPTLLEWLSPNLGVGREPGGIFYDLGAGTGKAVLMAALLGNFQRVVGVEIIPELQQEARRIAERFATEYLPNLPALTTAPQIDFYLGDFLLHDFSDATAIFIQATCLPPEELQLLEANCRALPHGCRLITVTEGFEGAGFRLLKKQKYPLGWGEGTVHLYEKTR